LGGRIGCWWSGTEGQGMPVFEAFKVYVTAEIKVTITGRSMNTDLVVIPGGDLTTAGDKFSNEETIHNHLE
jgi:hypothetical protein